MAYYLGRGDGGELYNITLELTEEEPRCFRLQEDAVVRAVCIWSSAKSIENFRQRLSATRPDDYTPLEELVHDMCAGRVEILKTTPESLIGQLRGHSRTGFVVVDPGPEQKVEWLDRFLLHLWGACKHVPVEAR